MDVDVNAKMNATEDSTLMVLVINLILIELLQTSELVIYLCMWVIILEVNRIPEDIG